MKVVYLNYLYDMKESSVGAAVHIRELSKAIERCGHQVKVFYLNRFTSVEASVRSPVRRFLKHTFSRYFNQLHGLISNGRYFLKEWEILSREKPDVLLVRYNLLNFSVALAARCKGVPFVLEVNAPMAYESRTFADVAVRLPFVAEWLERYMLRVADRIYVVSKMLKRFFVAQHIPESKIAVIPNGVDAHRFCPDISTKRVFSAYPLKRKTVLGFIGSFHYWHGVANLMHFIKAVLSKSDDTAFLLVGDGPLKKELEHRVKMEHYSDRVFFTGYVPYPEIPAYLAAMDIALAPYPDLEFFYYSPLKLFEYMAAGKAVVAARIGQIEEIIQDGVNGMLFEPGNFQDMVAKAFTLIQNRSLRKRIAEKGRRTIEEGYTWDRAARVLSNIFQEIIATPHPQSEMV